MKLDSSVLSLCKEVFAFGCHSFQYLFTYRNGLMPKKLHLEIALGNFYPKEGICCLIALFFSCSDSNVI